MDLMPTPPYLHELEKRRAQQMREYYVSRREEGIHGQKLKAEGQMYDPKADALAVIAHNTRQTAFEQLHVFQCTFDAYITNDPEESPFIQIRVDYAGWPEFWLHIDIDRTAFIRFIHAGRPLARNELSATGRIERSDLVVHPTSDPDWPHLRVESHVNTPNTFSDTTVVRTHVNKCSVCIRHRDFPLFMVNVELDISRFA